MVVARLTSTVTCPLGDNINLRSLDYRCYMLFIHACLHNQRIWWYWFWQSSPSPTSWMCTTMASFCTSCAISRPLLDTLNHFTHAAGSHEWYIVARLFSEALWSHFCINQHVRDWYHGPRLLYMTSQVVQCRLLLMGWDKLNVTCCKRLDLA